MNQNDYYDAGYRVFGLCGRCDINGDELSEKEQFKKPIATNWQHTPLWSEEQFDTMHEMGYFETGFGVVVDGLLIIDVDARNGGVDSFSKLCKDINIDLLSESAFAVSTGSGNGSMHIYYKNTTQDSYMQHSDRYPGIDFKTTGFVVGAGSLHASGQEYEVLHGDICELTQAPQELLSILKRPEYHRTEYEGVTLDVTDADIKSMLSYYKDYDDYDAWVECGMAIHHATGGNGFALWDEWSQQSDKYAPEQMEKKWHSFGKSARPVTIGTIIHHAKQNGWRSNYDDVVFTTELTEDDDQETIIDLKRPPGFVGELTKWINEQSFFPRENLAVAAALTAVGSIAGLRYVDDLGFSANLYSLCVAGSSTGKESIQQSYARCLSAAGVSDALHGNVKSEQEMIRNIIRHQAAFYVIDEFGIFLKKIVNSSQKGGASYLEGVIGLFMSVYTKATAYLAVSGDLKEQVKTELLKEIAKAENELENNRGDEQHKTQLERALADVKNGIKYPYVTLMGFTTPVTFNDLISFEMATNGFMSRAMIFEEPETNPKPNKNKNIQDLPFNLESTLAALYNNGDTMQDRIEYYDKKSVIRSTKDAGELLDKVGYNFWKMAEDAKAQGLEAIPRRGYEQVCKVSLILAIPEGLRTVEHVRWANALVKTNIDKKMKLAYVNINEKDDPATAIATKIQTMLTDIDEPLAHSIIVNRCRPHKREAVDQVIIKLVEKNLLVAHEGKRGGVKYSIKRG